MNFSVSKLMLAGAVTGVLVCAMTTTALAADLTAGVGTVTASALKLRAEASTSSECLSLLPKGAVVLLDYAASAADVEREAALSPEERAGHLRQLTRHWRDYARICSTVEMMAAIGGDVGWT